MVAPLPMLRACCMCHRVQVDAQWVPQPAAVQGPALLTHTYCPTCFQQALAPLRPSVPAPQLAELELACG